MVCRLIAGCGYVGSRVAQKWIASGDTVFAFSRTPMRCLDLNAMGIHAIQWDWLSKDGPKPSKHWDQLQEIVSHHRLATILIAISHATIEGMEFTETHARGLANTLRELGGNLVISSPTKWIYLSTTGVFGSVEPDAWIDEQSPVSPTRPGALAAWGGEQWISQNVSFHNAVRVRPAGIYGPKRVPRWQSIRDSIPLEVQPDSFLNLIHVDDLACMIFELSNRPTKHGLYCIADLEPVQRRNYFEFISQIASLPAPIYASVLVQKSSRENSRREGSKRIRSDRIVQELNYDFRFPTYREGLTEVLREAIR